VRDLAALRGTGDFDTFNLMIIIAIALGTIAAICYFERAHRRIPVQYTKRVVGRKMYGGTQTHLPLKINVSGVIPPIFASSILMFPQQLVSMSDSAWLASLNNALRIDDW